ncbi:MAG: DUF4197 domain-containing protein [Porticoccaceae bacterium]|nr:DUF4197 domain-containing protein [Porticoccaceae bacterium]
MPRPFLKNTTSAICLAVVSLTAGFVLSACTPTDYNTMASAAETRLRQRMAEYFLRQFGNGIDSILSGLAAAGGFMDNPLVKILLPPPLGLAMAVGQALHQDPQAALLDTLINQAAATVVPGAAPILKAALNDAIASGNAEKLFSGDKTAVTDYLREQTSASLNQALRPAIADALDKSGATTIYNQAVNIHHMIKGMEEDLGDISAIAKGEVPVDAVETPRGESPASTADSVTLEDYVTERAIEGIFKTLEQREGSLRQRLQRQPGLQ